MSIETCIIKAKKFLEDEGTVKVSGRKLEVYGRRLEAAGGDALTKAEFYGKLSDFVQEDLARESKKLQALRAQDLGTHVDNVENTLENAKTWNEKIGNTGKAVVEAMMAHILGNGKRPGMGVNMDPRASANGMFNNYSNALIKELGPDNLKIFQSRAVERQIYQELSEMNNPNGILGQSKSPEALAIAKAIKTAQNLTLKDRMAMSPFMEAAQDFIAERTHSRELVAGDNSDASKAAWLQQALKTYGEKSFPGLNPTEKAAALLDIREKIVSGQYGSLEAKNPSKSFNNVPGVGGDLAKQMSAGRTLIAKDWQGEYEYMSKYGNDLYTSTINALQGAAKDTAMISKWGTKPQEAFHKYYASVEKSLDEESRQYVQSKKDHIEDAFKVTAGYQNASPSNFWSKSAVASMNVESLAKLGAHVFRALPDLNNAIMISKNASGKTLPEAMFSIMSNFAKQMSPFGDAAERMGDFGLMRRTQHASLMNELGTTDGSPGVMSRLIEGLGHITLAERFTNSLKDSMASDLSKNMGEVKHLSFEKISPYMQQTLKRYGIDEDLWDVVRRGEGKTKFLEGQDRPLVTPDSVRGASDTAVEIYLRKTGQWTKADTPPARVMDRVRLDATNKIATLLNHNADMAAGMSDSGTRFTMYGKTNINSGMGVLRRFATQYKSAQFTSLELMKRSYFDAQGVGSSGGLAAGRFLVGNMVAFMMGDLAYQLAQNKTPEDPRSLEGVAKMIIGSGAGGMYGDSLINAMQYGGSKEHMGYQLAKSTAGPVIGDLADILFTGVQATQKKFDRNTPRDAAHIIEGLVPGHNIFYLKAPLQYSLINAIHETLGDKGHIGMLEKMMAKTPSFTESGHQEHIVGGNQ